MENSKNRKMLRSKYAFPKYVLLLCYPQDADFTGAKLENAYLVRADLTGADLSASRLFDIDHYQGMKCGGLTLMEPIQTIMP
jgi:uncharacterized protein YjbI with pentapeptide repeats